MLFKNYLTDQLETANITIRILRSKHSDAKKEILKLKKENRELFNSTLRFKQIEKRWMILIFFLTCVKYFLIGKIGFSIEFLIRQWQYSYPEYMRLNFDYEIGFIIGMIIAIAMLQITVNKIKSL